MRGGYTCYGQDIGILMLDTDFPRIRGDIGNATTFPFPVRYKIVRNVFQGSSLPSDADQVLLHAFCEAAKELETDGCRAITTSCGFLAGFQQELAAAVHIPVFTSVLALVPMIYPMIRKDEVISIFTAKKELMTENLFRKNGWSSKDIPVHIFGLEDHSAFNELVIHNQSSGDFQQIRQEISGMVDHYLAEEPHSGAVVLECQNLAPYGRLIQKKSGVPVFGINQLIAFMESAVNYPDYRPAYGDD